MNTLLVLSFIFEIVATAWAAFLLWKLRDWRIAFLAGFLFLMAVRKILILQAIDPQGNWENQFLRGIMDYVILAISIMAVLAVGCLHLYISKRGREETHIRMLAQGLNNSVAPVLITDANMEKPGPKIVFVNDAMCALCGYSREELMGQTPRILQGPLTDRDTMKRLRDELAAGKTFVGETINYKRDGTPYWIHWSISPVHNRLGRVTHYISLQKDMSDGHLKDISLRAALDRLGFHVDNAPIGIIEWDRDFRVSLWSHGAVRLFGWKAEEVLGKHPADWSLVYPDDDLRVREIMRQLQTDGTLRNNIINRNLTRDGAVIWCHWHNSVRHDSDGRFNSILSFILDVTERHDAEERQRLLLLELDHRVKNNLATVIGIAEQTLSSSTTLNEFGDSFLGRIAALAHAHGLLAKASWEGIDLAELCSHILRPYIMDQNPRVDLEGPRVSLSAVVGGYLALSLYELMTNAVKYGALSNSTGRIVIRWNSESGAQGPMLNVIWKEHGGPPVTLPDRNGFGSEFILAGIRYDLKGEAKLEYETDGLCCRMRIPLQAENGKDAHTHLPGRGAAR